jgi:hypothetical protein
MTVKKLSRLFNAQFCGLPRAYRIMGSGDYEDLNNSLSTRASGQFENTPPSSAGTRALKSYKQEINWEGADMVDVVNGTKVRFTRGNAPARSKYRLHVVPVVSDFSIREDTPAPALSSPRPNRFRRGDGTPAPQPEPEEWHVRPPTKAQLMARR